VFLGHFAAGFAAKTAAPKTSLGTLFLAAQFIDLLWPILLLAGIERVRIAPGITAVTPLDFEFYPFSHSLAAVAGWAGLLAAAYYAVRRYKAGALVVGVLVVSHWLLDAVVHRPDLPVLPGWRVQVGLGLWNSPPGTLVFESLLFGCGLYLYARRTTAGDRIGQFALWGLAGFLVVVYLANVFGAAPPSVTAIAWTGQLQWLLIAWGYWSDRHRRVLRSTRSAGDAAVVGGKSDLA
jgi:hypothetical protein